MGQRLHIKGWLDQQTQGFSINVPFGWGLAPDWSGKHTRKEVAMPHTATSRPDTQAFIKSVHGVRYHVKDVARSVTFYTQHLGFKLEHQQLPAFASVSLGDSQILLSGPGASGSRPMPNGQRQEPGGWNRIVRKSRTSGAVSPCSRAPAYASETRWKAVPADVRFRLKTRTATRSSCLNHRDD